MPPKPNFVKKPIKKILDESIDRLPNTDKKTSEQLEAQGCLYARNCKYPRCDCYADNPLSDGIDSDEDTSGFRHSDLG